jgi:hypothetical protein
MVVALTEYLREYCALEALLDQLNVPETETKVLALHYMGYACSVGRIVYVGVGVCVCTHGDRCMSALGAICSYLKILKMPHNTMSL